MAKDDAKTKTETQTTDAAKPLVYALSEPVEFNKEIVTEVPYRRATGRDIRKMLNTHRSGDRYMVAMVEVFQMPEAFWNLIPACDFMAITDIIDGFFERPKSA